MGYNGDLPSGKHTKNYGKSQFWMGQSIISMAIFNSYVKLPEGNHETCGYKPMKHDIHEILKNYVLMIMDCEYLWMGCEILDIFV